MAGIREPEKTEKLTALERKVFAQRLRDVADQIDSIHEVAGSEKAIWVFRKPSLKDGMRRIEAFATDLRKTKNLLIMEKPLNSKSKKTAFADA